MPEAAVHKHGDMATGEDEVWSATVGDLPVQPEPPSGGVDRLTQLHLRRRVALDAAPEMGTLQRARPLLCHPDNYARRWGAQSKSVQGRGRGPGRSWCDLRSTPLRWNQPECRRWSVA